MTYLKLSLMSLILEFIKKVHKDLRFVIFTGLSFRVLIFCVELWELSHLTRDLSQAEKKLNVDTSCANAQYGIYFTQNGQSCYFE